MLVIRDDAEVLSDVREGFRERLRSPGGNIGKPRFDACFRISALFLKKLQGLDKHILFSNRG